MRELLLVEARVALVYAGQVEEAHDLVDRQLLPVVLRDQPSRQRKLTSASGRKPRCWYSSIRAPWSRFDILPGPFCFRISGNVGVDRQRRPEGLEELRVLARVRKVVLAADHVGDLHRDVVDDIDEVEHRVAVGAHDHEVLLLRALDPAADRVLDHLGLARDLEENRPVLLVGPAGRLQLLEVFPVDLRPLALPVGAERPAGAGTLVPVQAQPRRLS